MKKLLFITLAAFIAFNCFAETRVVEESDDYSDSALILNFGDTYYNTNRLSVYNNIHDIDLNSNGFTVEIGRFKSDEDGLFDFVSTDLLGFSAGKINSENNYSWRDNNNLFDATSNARHYTIFGKETFGLQANVFMFSFGCTFGPKYGFDWMKMNAYSPRFRNYVYHENRLFLDFVVDPYISLNLKKRVKIFLKSDFDLPIFRARFVYSENEGSKSGTTFSWDWFKNDVPTTFMIGCAVFF